MRATAVVPKLRSLQSESVFGNNEPARLKNLLMLLERDGQNVNCATYAEGLEVCSRLRALEEGRRIHAHIAASGLERHRYLVSLLVVMYGKCGALDEAEKLHERMHQGSVYSWTALIRACNQNGQPEKAVQCFREMLRLKLKPAFNTFTPLANACATLQDLEAGIELHAQISSGETQMDVALGNALIRMYRKCRSLEGAEKVFEEMPCRNVVTWNTLIAGYVQNDLRHRALELFNRMRREKIKPSSITYTVILDSCVGLLSFTEAKQLHAEIVHEGMEGTAMVGAALIHMYGRFREMDEARHVFYNIKEHNLVSWTAMIAACGQNGCGGEALHLFRAMQQQGFRPDVVTFVSVLNVCTGQSSEAVDGIQVQIADSGLLIDDILGTALLSTYGRCNNVAQAREMFNELRTSRDIVPWNAMLAVYIQHSCYKEALLLFQDMLLEGMKPAVRTLATLVGACAEPAALEKGKQLHSYAAESGIQTNIFVANAFLSMFGKCGSIQDAKLVFETMRDRDVVSWNAMIGAYAQDGHGRKALELFNRMQSEHVDPNNITFVSVLDASCTLMAPEEVENIYARIVAAGLENDPLMQAALLNMYAKCGKLDLARKMFDCACEQCVVSWTTLVTGHAQHGDAVEALRMFRRMQQCGVRPNQVTFLGALAACNHAGLLEEGCAIFSSMNDEYATAPSAKHIGCMTSLLGRSGRFSEAERLVKRLPAELVQPWMAMLSACKDSPDVNRGQRCADKIMELDPSCGAAYANLASIYCSSSSSIVDS